MLRPNGISKSDLLENRFRRCPWPHTVSLYDTPPGLCREFGRSETGHYCSHSRGGREIGEQYGIFARYVKFHIVRLLSFKFVPQRGCAFFRYREQHAKRLQSARRCLFILPHHGRIVNSSLVYLWLRGEGDRHLPRHRMSRVFRLFALCSAARP